MVIKIRSVLHLVMRFSEGDIKGTFYLLIPHLLYYTDILNILIIPIIKELIFFDVVQCDSPKA